MLTRCTLIFIISLFYNQTVSAISDPVSTASGSTVIASIDYLREQPKSPLSLQEVILHFKRGESTLASRSFLTFGISNQPTWVRLSLSNSSKLPLYRRLTAGQTWIERLDVYLVSRQQKTMHWNSGDGKAADGNLLPEVGFVYDLQIPPGESQIFIRAESFDPLTLPIQLLTSEEVRHSDVKSHLAAGVLYGILFALVGYNIILYMTLKQVDALYYSLYISCFVVMNLGYSGYGFAWFYPDHPLIQNYTTLLFMVLHGVCGLVFVSKFLVLQNRMPRLFRFIRFYIIGGVSAIILFIALQNQLLSALIAFSFLSITTLVMIVVGIMNLGKVRDAQYFLLAVLCSMVGLLVTTLSVWGHIPYTNYGFHAAAFGVVLEAMILAVILANRLKAIESERIAAKYLSSYDPLTKLFNRRYFVQAGNELINSKSDHLSPFSFVIMDIDYFKSINDQHGHHIGDLALSHMSGLLRKNSRESDIIARWGGEEIVILLSSTDMAQAFAYTEHLRSTIENSPLVVDDQIISMTASFGIATRDQYETLEQLFKQADKQLYSAKRQGRNRVEPRTNSSMLPSVS